LRSSPDTSYNSCPVLRELECRNVDSATLIDVVLSRATTGSILPLDSISLDSGDDSLHPTLADCLKLSEVGIKITSKSSETS
jgi:hypothetical protein